MVPDATGAAVTNCLKICQLVWLTPRTVSSIIATPSAVHISGGRTSLAIGDVFEVAEIEEPVLSNGPTDGAAEPILIKPLPVGNASPS